MPTNVRNSLPNSSPKLAEAAVEVMHKYQELGRDVELLRDFLVSPYDREGIDVRIAACLLSASVLTQWLVRMQITALNEGRIR